MSSTMAQWAVPLLVACFFVAVHSISDDAAKLKTQIFDDCKNEEGLSQGDIQAFFDMTGVAGLSGHPCMVKCVLSKYDVIADDGQIIEEKAAPIQAEVWPSEAELSTLQKVTENCANNTPKDSDVCQYVYKQVLCAFESMTK